MLEAGSACGTRFARDRCEEALMKQSDFVQTGQKVGLVMASVVTPSTLAPSLSKRSWQDQGLITGLSTGGHYLFALTSQDVIDVIARAAAGAATTWGLFPQDWPDERRNAAAALGCEVGMVPVGLGLTAYLDRRGVHTARQGLERQLAWRMGATALSGTVLIGATAGVRRLDRALGAGGRLASLPLSIPVGLATAAVIDRFQRAGTGSEVEPADEVPAAKGLAAGAGVLAILYGAAWADGDTATCSLGTVRLAPTAHRGRVQLMLRPEQIRVDEHGPIRGVVLDTDYFGPESTVRLELRSGREPGCETSTLAREGQVIIIRHSSAFIAPRGTELRLRIEGEAIAFPPNA
jgi:hypothetical protein